MKGGRDLILTAEPGAGKTTRVPRALLESGALADQECWVLEPRRLAARLAAARVAEELGEAPGGASATPCASSTGCPPPPGSAS